MLIWGTLPVFVSKIPFGSAEIVMWRILFGFAFLLVVFLATKKKSPGENYKKAAPRLIISGIIMGANKTATYICSFDSNGRRGATSPTSDQGRTKSEWQY